MAITDARIFHYHVLSQLDKFLECGFVTLGVLPRLHGNQSVVLFFFCLFAPVEHNDGPQWCVQFCRLFIHFKRVSLLHANACHTTKSCGLIGAVTSYFATYPLHFKMPINYLCFSLYDTNFRVISDYRDYYRIELQKTNSTNKNNRIGVVCALDTL